MLSHLISNSWQSSCLSLMRYKPPNLALNYWLILFFNQEVRLFHCTHLTFSTLENLPVFHSGCTMYSPIDGVQRFSSFHILNYHLLFFDCFFFDNGYLQVLVCKHLLLLHRFTFHSRLFSVTWSCAVWCITVPCLLLSDTLESYIMCYNCENGVLSPITLY